VLSNGGRTKTSHPLMILMESNVRNEVSSFVLTIYSPSVHHLTFTSMAKLSENASSKLETLVERGRNAKNSLFQSLSSIGLSVTDS